MVARTFTAVLHREDDLYVAECPEVGTVSQGYTIEEAVLNLKEATELYLEEFPMRATSHPILTTFEAVAYA
jgi:predicted RNase H-like HicB family nuclease